MRQNDSPFFSFTVDKQSAVPIYQQIGCEINCIIQTAQLAAGVSLPPIRSLAEHLQVNPNTVVRAYAELESAGRIRKRRGSGCVVADTDGHQNQAGLEAVLKGQIEDLVSRAAAMGIGRDALARRIAGSADGSEVNISRKPRDRSQQVRNKTEPPATNEPTIWQPGNEFVD